MKNSFRTLLAIMALTLGSHSVSQAQGFCIPFLTCPVQTSPTKTSDAPEIDAAMGAAGVALVGGAVFMLRGRRKTK